MTPLLIIASAAIYLLPMISFWRQWAWKFDQDSSYTRGEAVVIGFIQAIIWPVTWVAKAMKGDWFLLPPKDIRREAESQRLKQRNKELERQLEIKP